MSQMIAEIPQTERPRERLQRQGGAALSNRELLAILLRNGTVGRSALDLAAELLQHFDGNLSRIATATRTELCRIHGIGQSKACELQAAFTLATRLTEEQLGDAPAMDTPETVACYMREHFRQNKQEEFHVLLLDTRMRLIRDEIVSIGLLDRSLVHPREVFRGAIREACQNLILCHNHPSGESLPSPEDIAVTGKLREAGELIGIRVTDHIIIGAATQGRKRDFFSFRANGMLAAPT